MRVTLDIAGFYYRQQVELPDDDVVNSVKDVMIAAQALGGTPSLSFAGEIIDGREFLDNITVTHRGNSAVSGQTLNDATADQRIYDDGAYAAADDFVIFGSVDRPDGTTLKRLISPEGKRIVSAWQYYVYDAQFVDLNRRGGTRRVVPYSVPLDVGDELRGIRDGDTVVWRRISSCLGPTVDPILVA